MNNQYMSTRGNRRPLLLALLLLTHTVAWVPAAEASDRGTRMVKTADFEISLPGQWNEAHESTHFNYFDDARAEQVTIQVAQARVPLDGEALTSAVNQLVSVRQKAVRELSGGLAEFSDLRTQVSPGQVDAEFTGSDPKNQVQFHVLVRGRPERTVTVSYIKYAPALASAAFKERAKLILGSLKVK